MVVYDLRLNHLLQLYYYAEEYFSVSPVCHGHMLGDHDAFEDLVDTIQVTFRVRLSPTLHIQDKEDFNYAKCSFLALERQAPRLAQEAQHLEN